MALLYALDVAPLQKVNFYKIIPHFAAGHAGPFPSLTFKCEDRESAPVTRLPIVRDPQFIPRIHRELGPGSARRWEHAGLQSAAQFAWAMTVAAARANGGTAGTALPAEAVAAVIDDDEAAVDAALDNRSVRVRLYLDWKKPPALKCICQTFRLKMIPLFWLDPELEF